MAWATPAMGGAFTAPMKPKTSLLDRALNDLGNIGSGLLPGIAEMGSAVTHDIGALAPFTPNKFKLPGLGAKVATGMWNESALPPLLLGDPVEAFHRANARPVSALLDFSLLAPASSGVARLATLPKSTRAGAFDFLGYKQTTPEFAVGSAMDMRPLVDNPDKSELSLWETPENLPSTVPFADGTHAPMREYFAAGADNVARRGDELWMRQAKRTMTPMSHPETMLEQAVDDQGNPLHDGAQSKDLVDLFAKSQDPLVSGVETLGADPWRKYTNPRAESQPLALIGDQVEALRNKIPDNKRFSTSSRIGKRMYRNNELDRLHDIDAERADHEKALLPVIAALREREEFKGFSDEQLRERLGNETYRRSIQGDAASLEDAIREFNPEVSMEGVSFEKLAPLTVRQAKDEHGFYFDRVNKHEPDPLPGDDDNFGEWVAANQEALLKGKESPYELKVRSTRHKAAVAQQRSAKGSAAERIQSLLNESPLLSPVIRNVKTNETMVVDKVQLHNDPSILDRILDDEDWEVTFNNEGRSPMATARKEGEAGNVQQQARADNLAFREAVSEYKKHRAKRTSFDEHSSFSANQVRMLADPKANILAREGQAGPGIMGVLERIKTSSLEGIDTPEIQAYMDHLDGIRAKSADNVTEWLGDELFDGGAKTRNENRGVEWTHDREGKGDFYPMKTEVAVPRGKFIAERTRDDLQDDPSLKQVGNPFDLFLKGKFRTDYKVILDDFEQNRSFAASSKLLNEAKNLSMKLTPEQYKKYQNKEIDEASAMGEKYGRGTFVRLDNNGELAHQIRMDVEGLERLAMMFDSIDPVAAESARLAAKAVKESSPIKNPMDAPLEGAMRDSEVRTALKGGEDLPDQMIEVMPTEMYKALRNEYIKGQDSLDGAFRLMTDLWKHTVLHMRFAQWMKNNVIGGHIMVIMAGGPKAYLKMQGMRFSRPGDFKEIMGDDGILKNNMNDVLASGSSMQARETNLAPEDTFYGQYQRKFINPLSEFNAKWADDPVRKIRLMQLMDQQLGTLAKLSGKKAADLTPEQVQKFMDDPVMRDELATRTNTDMVDFSDMSEDEKKYLRSLFPFWSWMKGSAKATQRLAADHPGRVWAAGEVADVGEMAAVEDQGEHLPDFAKGWWDPGETGGNVIDTGGMNPYGNALDFIGMGMGAMPDLIPGDMSSGASYRQFGSENMLSSVHPFLSGGIESATGKSLFFGTPMENQSMGSGFLKGQMDLPLYNFLSKQVKNETGPDATTEYHRGQAALNYMLGIPEKDPRWGQVNARGWDEISERYGNGLASRELAPGWVR